MYYVSFYYYLDGKKYYDNFFGKYLSFVDDVPSFYDTLRLYRKRAKKYGCFYIYIALTILDSFGHSRIPRGVLKRLNKMRMKIRRRKRKKRKSASLALTEFCSEKRQNVKNLNNEHILSIQ